MRPPTSLPDFVAERRWIARWRENLIVRCGQLKKAQARDVREGREGIPPPFDEIDAIVFAGEPR